MYHQSPTAIWPPYNCHSGQYYNIIIVLTWTSFGDPETHCLQACASLTVCEALSHPGTRPLVLWTGKLQGWTGIPVQQLVVDG